MISVSSEITDIGAGIPPSLLPGKAAHQSGKPASWAMSIRPWIPLCVLSGIALALRDTLPNWAFMWIMAAGVFFGCKWVTVEQAWRAGLKSRLLISMGYLFVWPGMDAQRFFHQRQPGRLAMRIGGSRKGFLLWAALKVTWVCSSFGWRVPIGSIWFL
jgi:hypothetical protein